MPLTDTERADYLAKLQQAEATYHTLMMGQGVREFTDQNGERIAYTGANASGLLRYINYLRSLLGLCSFTGGSSGPPAGVYL